ncbi:hypothetical protein LSH36_478g02006 [Paralvinella palmiformis]|uniref:Uncharacterized protein n=1 Tax=Paralvinella palmiformis TaxID=53620 RepID=A0AAD9MZM3_9ANNE|nr:hypothetical protein LSH36_478g02006 [Paralvinella palmiformis]
MIGSSSRSAMLSYQFGEKNSLHLQSAYCPSVVQVVRSLSRVTSFTDKNFLFVY